MRKYKRGTLRGAFLMPIFIKEGGHMAAGKTVGRPPKYKSKEEIEEKIDAYFKECEGEILKDDEGKPVLK